MQYIRLWLMKIDQSKRVWKWEGGEVVYNVNRIIRVVPKKKAKIWAQTWRWGHYKTYIYGKECYTAGKSIWYTEHKGAYAEV